MRSRGRRGAQAEQGEAGGAHIVVLRHREALVAGGRPHRLLFSRQRRFARRLAEVDLFLHEAWTAVSVVIITVNFRLGFG